MKSKVLLATCVMSLAAILGGCGSNDKSSSNVKVDELTPTAGAQVDAAEVEAAYMSILKTAPGLDLTNPELSKLTLNYDENIKMFGMHIEDYAIVDVNKDGVSELIATTVVNPKWSQISVYTYADGRAELLKNPADASTPGTLTQNSSAEGTYVTYICEDNHIHSVWKGTDASNNAEEKNEAYAIEGTTLKAVECSRSSADKKLYLYDIAKENEKRSTSTVVPTQETAAKPTDKPADKPAVTEKVEPTKAPATEPTKAPATEPTKAPSANVSEDAVKAYKAILKNAQGIAVELRGPLHDLTFNYDANIKGFGKHIEDYVFIDINRDGVPEMITRTIVNDKWDAMGLYTYVNGKAVFVKGVDSPYADVTFNQNACAGGTFKLYFCEGNHIHSVWNGTNPSGQDIENNDAYTFNGTSLSVARCDYIGSNRNADFDSIAQINKEQ